MNKKRLYAIYDRATEDIIGVIHAMTHDTPAIRLFCDVAAAQGSMIKQHPEDFSLVCLGTLESNYDAAGTLELDHEFTVVFTGLQWAAIQPSQDTDQAPRDTKIDPRELRRA